MFICVNWRPKFPRELPNASALIQPQTNANSLALTGIPPETLDYRLGSRSALEWIVDQYQVKGDSDPNREDDPHYIVLLVGQVSASASKPPVS